MKQNKRKKKIIPPVYTHLNMYKGLKIIPHQNKKYKVCFELRTNKTEQNNNNNPLNSTNQEQ